MSLSGAISDAYSKDGVKDYDPTQKEMETSSFIKKQWDDSERAKTTLVEDAWIGLAYYTGRQWSHYNRITRLVTEDNPPPWRVRMVLNYVLPTVETLAGKLVENRPGFISLPASNDDDDVEAARQAEQLLNYLWKELNMQVKLHEAVKWMAITGTVFFKTWWDASAGEEYETSDEIQAAIDRAVESGEEEPEEKKPKKAKTKAKKKTGLPVIEVLSPLEVGWDPGAKDIESCRWIVHTNMMHIDEIRERWEKGKYVSADAGFDSDQYSQQVLREFSRNINTDDALMDRVAVYEYFERPSPRHPNGYYAIVAGNIVLEEEEALPYNDLPFVIARHITVPGKLCGEGVVKAIVPPQKEVNKSVSQRIEAINLMSSPKWRAEKGSVDKSALTDEPGEVIFYSRTASRPPEPIPPPPLSPAHMHIEKEQIEHIQNISGVNDVTRGAASPQMSGRAIGLLADLDQTKLGPTVRELESAIERMCSKMLWMWREYMPIPFTLQVTGRDALMEVFEFHRSQIKTTRVRVVGNSMLPKHPSYRREQVMQMFQVGLLGPPQEPETQMKARKLMEFGDLNQIYGDQNRDRYYAREENQILSNGKWSDPKPWEDHVTHIDEHMNFMKSIDFRLLPEESQLAFEKHVAWHYHAESQQQQGGPWWAPYSEAGMEGFPPVPQPEAAPPGMPAGPEGGSPLEMLQAGGPGGLVGGGTPELNQAVGTRGPGRPDFEAGFEASPR